MRLFFKFLFAIIALIVLVTVGVTFYLYQNGQDIIKEGVSRYGPEITGTSISIDQIRFSPLSGSAGLGRLNLGSPQGFTSPYLMNIGQIDLKLKPKSLFEDVIHIEHLKIKAPNIVYERAGGKANIDQLQKNIEASTSTNTAEDTEQARDIIIDILTIEDAELHFRASSLGISDQALKLASIELRDIGVSEGGIQPSEVARLTMSALTPQITKALATSQGKQLLQKALGDKLNLETPIKDQAKDVIEGKAKKKLKKLFGDKN